MTDKSVSFSVLDLAPIPQGSSAKEAFSHSLDLAQLAEKRGAADNYAKSLFSPFGLYQMFFIMTIVPRKGQRESSAATKNSSGYV